MVAINEGDFSRDFDERLCVCECVRVCMGWDTIDGVIRVCVRCFCMAE